MDVHVRRTEEIKGDVYEELNKYGYVWPDLIEQERACEYQDRHAD